MNKNQKIALGCGGAGCLGLIVVLIIGALGYLFWMKPASSNRVYNFNVSNTNLNTNSNSNTDSNSNSNNNNSNATNGDGNSNGTATSSTSMSDDDKHKLYQAASMTGDTELLRRVSVKLGLMNEDFTPGDEYVGFVRDHVVWALRNSDFIQSLNSKEKAVAYVNEHFPE